jgi:hypothetical protein
MNIKRVLGYRRLSGVTLISFAAVAALVAFAPQAEATDRNVPAQYPTITLAIAAASPGDNVKVAPGTYYEQVVIYKAITVQGAGIGKSIIDGDTSLLSDAGQVRINAPGNVKFSGFTVRKAGVTGFGDRMSIFAAGPCPATVPMTYTISGNAIVGSNNPADSGDYGFYAQNACDTLVFTNNKISQTGSDPIVLERHYGASEVGHNTFDRGVSDGSVDACFSMNYGGPDITTLQRVHDNKIDMGSGASFGVDQRGFAITFAGAFADTFPGADGGFTNVQIDHNEIVNLKPYRRGINLWNNAAGAGGDVTGVITDNKITGAAGDVTGTIGVRLLGLINDTVIGHNTLSKLATGIQLRNWNGGNANDATISSNSMTALVLGVEMQDGASSNLVLQNTIYVSGHWTVTMSAGTSGNAVVLNHLRAASPPATGNATVQDLDSNIVNSNTN